jgi:hypothetical protein
VIFTVGSNPEVEFICTWMVLWSPCLNDNGFGDDFID